MRDPFDDPACIFELKYDGFRALAFIDRTSARFVSRNGSPLRRFASLATALRTTLRVDSAVLDGELVVLDDDGRPQFDALLFRRGAPSFVTFDVLALNGRDLRARLLLERKRALRRIVPSHSDCLLYAQHVRGRGCKLFETVCALDLEGIVAKRAESPYRMTGERSPWTKVKFREYSKARDRHELFARR